MAPNDIAEDLRRHPFTPLRIFLSDGATYEVKDPVWCGLNQTEMFIGLDPDDSGVPRRSAYVDTRHVTRIEPLLPASSH